MHVTFITIYCYNSSILLLIIIANLLMCLIYKLNKRLKSLHRDVLGTGMGAAQVCQPVRNGCHHATMLASTWIKLLHALGGRRQQQPLGRNGEREVKQAGTWCQGRSGLLRTHALKAGRRQGGSRGQDKHELRLQVLGRCSIIPLDLTYKTEHRRYN